jgi:hypothetical protein
MSTAKIQRPSRSCRPNPLFTSQGNGYADPTPKAASKKKVTKKAKNVNKKEASLNVTLFNSDQAYVEEKVHENVTSEMKKQRYEKSLSLLKTFFDQNTLMSPNLT